MPLVLVVGGGLLGALLGAMARATYGPAEWSNSKRISLLAAMIVVAGITASLHSFRGQHSRLPQLACYLVSLITGYIVAAMLDRTGASEEAGVRTGPPPASPFAELTKPTR
jgi:hypothetical protein